MFSLHHAYEIKGGLGLRLKKAKPNFSLAVTHCIHVLGEQQVGETEVPVEDGMGVQVEQPLHHLTKDTLS